MKNKPTDRGIIMDLYKKTKNEKISWYKTKSTNDADVWKSNEKITNEKSLCYTIYHKKNIPQNSHLVIYFVKYSNNKTKSDLKKIKTIYTSSSIMLLLRVAIEYNGDDVLKKTYSIINNKNNKNEILLIKKTDKLYWSLPSDIVKGDNMDKSVDKMIKKQIGIEIIKKEPLKYRNIFYDNDQYINVIPYLINNYSDDINLNNNTNKLTWVKLEDIFNWYIDEESRKILSYFNNTLPF